MIKNIVNSNNSSNPSSLEILAQLKQIYPTSNLQLKLTEVLALLDDKFPLSIINKKLTILESVVKYLKENKGYSLHKISEILNRNEKNIWHAYHSAVKKFPSKLKVVSNSICVPLDIFSKSLSPLENLVLHLHATNSLHEIAVLLNRNDRTIWTTYTRARRKYENK